MNFSQLKEKALTYLPEEKLAPVESAFNYAQKAHCGQLRKSGEPYLEHPLQTAFILAELQLDATSLAAALLHDVPENCGVPISEIEAKFGTEIAKLVDGTTKLGKLPMQAAMNMSATQTQVENLRKMLVAMAEDLRVVFIKLADRLHNMRTLAALPPEKQRRIAQETMEIYAPLSHRLGIWELKWQLEDLAFRYLEPRKYRQIASLVASRRGHREEFIAKVIEILKAEFDKAGLKVEISGRPKHIYSIYQKMEKYAALGKEFGDIHDLLAIRVLVSTIPDCYTAVGIVHNLWRPLADEFNDFIANPKPNGYQSLHTTVMCMGTTPLEIQIRTHEMHHIAEYGVGAHWRYKEGENKDVHFEQKISWLRQLIDWHREFSGAEEFLESIKTDIFIDQVFVYTPKGEIKDLPKGATPLDFAYRVHTELGHQCIGAKVNGKLVPLSYQLNSGDVVEIITSKKDKGPSRDWLNPHLGYINTSHAKQKVRQWFKKQERADNVENGREILEKELKRLGIKLTERDKLTKYFNYTDPNDFLAAIGDGTISTRQIAVSLANQQEQTAVAEIKTKPTKATGSVIRVLGVENLATNLAQCCHPVPGDKIIGYITRSRGITVHRADCYNIVNEDEKDRLIQVEWSETDALYPSRIQVEVWDRVGLMRDISTVVAEEKVNISGISLINNDNNTITLYFTLETKGLPELSELLDRIEGIRGVISVRRLGDEVTANPPGASKQQK